MSLGEEATPQSMSSTVLLYSRIDDGHRLAFVRQFASILRGERATAGRLWFARKPVLFLMVEEAFLFYVAVAVLRAALGRRTCGFLFRPGPALEATDLRLRFKRLLLGLLLRIPSVTTLTIVRFAVEPRFAGLADGSIDDPQQWDLSDEELEVATTLRLHPSALVEEIRLSSMGRQVVGAIGRQDVDKGFDLLVTTYLDNEELRNQCLFAVGGKVDPTCQPAVDRFVAAGGYLANRRITDQEILELYAAADFVWCCYSRTYDQSSGVMGRAAQLGIPVFVRAGSLLHRICETESIAFVALEPGRTPKLPAMAVDPARGRSMRDRMRARSLRVIHEALFDVRRPADAA
jgi:hypothetical protein